MAGIAASAEGCGRRFDVPTLRPRLLARGWLKGGDPDLIQMLLDLAEWRQFPDGHVLYQSGDSAGELYAVAEGQIATSNHSHACLDVGHLHLYRPGEWFGYSPILRSEPRRFQAVSRTVSTLAVFREARLRVLLAERPEVWQLIGLLVDAQAKLNGLTALDLARRSPMERLCAALLRMSGCRLSDGADGPPYDVAMTQTELAEAANLSRNGATLRLADLEKNHLVRLRYRHVTVLDPAALRRLLDNG